MDLTVYLAGLGIAGVMSPLGCWIVWRRMPFLADSLGHGAFLGVVLSLMFSFPVLLGIGAISCTLGFLLLGHRRLFPDFPAEMGLAIWAYGSLALGLFLTQLFPHSFSGDPMHYLFGDLLAVTSCDVGLILGASILIGIFWFFYRKPLLLMILDQDLYDAEGHPSYPIKILFWALVLLGLTLCIYCVGGLLTPGLLVIPPAIARMRTQTPDQMMRVNFLTTLGCVFLGIFLSEHYNTSTGPSILIVALGALILVRGTSSLVYRKKSPKSS